jgi:TetR/AcrR family transcriptional regulator
VPSHAKPARRKPGRPATAGHTRAQHALVDAARRLFAEQGYSAVSMRQIAEGAGVNPAMIAYYFGGKPGLYEAVLEETLSPFLAKLRSLAEQSRGDIGDIRGVLEGYTRTLAANPWIPQLLVREVLFESGRFRERFIRQFASRGGNLLSRLVQHEIDAGQLRRDLDPALTALSLIGMALFPFISYPVAREVFGLEMNDTLVQRLIEHHIRLFLQGAEADKVRP